MTVGRRITKDFEIECLSPVHIGSGDKLTAAEYIFDEINNQITSNHDIPVYMNNLLKNYIKMLRYFTITKPESVIDILNKVPIKESFTDEIRNCLIILLDNVGSLKKEQISELGEIIVRHINYISSNKLELVTRNYRYYSALWNNLKIDANMIINDLDLSIFRYESGLSEIGEFVDNNRIELFKNFYKYLTPETREKLIKVFKLYEKECVDINISAIIELMMNAVYDFPNLQNIPVRTEEGRKIRSLFVPGEGYDCFISSDYSQVELRILAHMSGDPGLIAAFANKEDIHRRTAAEIMGVPFESVTAEQRSHAKAINFGIIYGISCDILLNGLIKPND